MQRLLEQPSILLDPDQITVKIPLRAAQAILKHFQTQQLGEAADLVTPLVEGVARAIDSKRLEVMKAVGKSAVDVYKEEQRVEAENAAREAAEEARRLCDEIAAEAAAVKDIVDVTDKAEADEGFDKGEEPPAVEQPALEAVNGSAQTST